MASTAGPYVLRPLIQDLPLATEDTNTQVVTTCVDFWDGNLYIGTSAAEVLHYVCLPADPGSGSHDDQFILASRTQPTIVASQNLSKGVQQLLILPRSKKACILCNGTLTFHSLPELSPAPNTQTVSNVLWIGGMNLDALDDQQEAADYVLMSLRTKMRLLRIGDRVTSPKSLDYPGCLVAARRGRYACVADARSYALVDLENSQKIPLFPISSLDDTAISFADRQSSAESQRTNIAGSPGSGHSRNTSLNAIMGNLGRAVDQRRLSTPRAGFETPEPRSGAASPSRLSSTFGTPQRPTSPSQNLAVPSQADHESPERPAQKKPGPNEYLIPQCVSPSATEFLLLTGTSAKDPGVGMFVNLDGDVVRGTLQFDNFPFKLILDDGGGSGGQARDSPDQIDSYIFAAIERSSDDGLVTGFEIHNWEEQSAPKAWIHVPTSQKLSNGLATFGAATAQTNKSFKFHEIGAMLRSARLDTIKSSSKQREDEASNQEDEFAGRLGDARAKVLVWYDSTISWAARNPFLLEIDHVIEGILQESQDLRLDQGKLIDIFRNTQKRDPSSETEFLSLEFIRQKISIILFADLAINKEEVDPRINAQLLLDGGIDPRVILIMIPFLRKDIAKGPRGIMISAGLVSMLKSRFSDVSISLESDPVLSRPGDFDILSLIKQYLSAWRQRKGFGSVADETNVFASVDSALIHVLLHQDQQTSLIPGRSSTMQVELYALLDNPIDCFDRAVKLLEQYRRLYALSRLYQSHAMPRKKLETWRRMLDGEPDDGGGLPDGENELRSYLVSLQDRELVEEYGAWLARRNPKLGVQVFTDEKAKIRFKPAQVRELLGREAPDAVKVYLEHLVFGKRNLHYADDLISYYLDNVLLVLESDKTALETLANSYETYRSLSKPKPTYRQFIQDNAIADSWWNDRLRLLELLGGSYGVGFSYDVTTVLNRIRPFEDALVPESIILEGRQGQHSQALHLLTHGLGDYHTAISYCLLGGSSIFHPAEATSSRGLGLPKPSRAEEVALFQVLLAEFLSIASPETRIEQTSELLSRFGRWFDVLEVLPQIPENWPVETMQGFLCGSLRKALSEKNESVIIKALAGAENLKVSVGWAEKMESIGPTIVPAMHTPGSMA